MPDRTRSWPSRGPAASPRRAASSRVDTPGAGPRTSGPTCSPEGYGARRSRLASRRAEAAGAAAARLEFLNQVELDLEHRYHDQLGDPVERLERERRLAAVPHRDHQRPLVIGVDQSHQIAEHDAALGAE